MKTNKGFTLVELLLTIAIIITISAVIINAVNKTPKDTKPTPQEESRKACITAGGIPILDPQQWDAMTDCKFAPKETVLPPCNGSDITGVPSDVVRQIAEARKGSCI